MATLEFFFDCTSPYSYLASTQIEALVKRSEGILRWRPVLLGAVFKATGNQGPTENLYKARYLLKDLRDWTLHYGLPEIVLPDTFPMSSLMADRLALVAEEQGKIAAFVHATYKAAFVEGKDISANHVMTDVLRAVGMDAQAAFARMLSQEIKDRLRQNTDEAVERGAFGVPTFFIGEDMYVGNDRLTFVEQALKKVTGVAA